MLLIAILVGIIVAVGIREHVREKTYKSNQKVWDEAVALIAHEMRTNLTSMSWAIQLILENYADKSLKRTRRC
jgi:sulfur relay (sulfurtransferase) DsrC/TusE family protein